MTKVRPSPTMPPDLAAAAQNWDRTATPAWRIAPAFNHRNYAISQMSPAGSPAWLTMRRITPPVPNMNAEVGPSRRSGLRATAGRPMSTTIPWRRGRTRPGRLRYAHCAFRDLSQLPYRFGLGTSPDPCVHARIGWHAGRRSLGPHARSLARSPLLEIGVRDAKQAGGETCVNLAWKTAEKRAVPVLWRAEERNVCEQVPIMSATATHPRASNHRSIRNYLPKTEGRSC